MTMTRCTNAEESLILNIQSQAIPEPNSPIHSLPPEILSKIFLLTFKDDPYSILMTGGPWLLGRVCRWWRDIAWCYPALWSSFKVNLPRQRSRTERLDVEVRILQEALHRARQSGLSMDIDADILCHDRADAITQTLLQHAPQWENIRLSGRMVDIWARQWSRFTDSSPARFPLLKSLHLDAHFPKGLHATLSIFNHAPILRHLRFIILIPLPMHFHPDKMPFPWSHLTHLHLSVFENDGATRGAIIKVLRLCTNLEELTEQSALCLEQDPISPLTLQKLCSLTVKSFRLLQCLVYPILEYLLFTMPPEEPGPSGSLPLFHQFFECSGSQLQTLDICIMGDSMDPVQLFSYLPRLHKLHLFFPDDNDKDPSRFFKCLGDTSAVLPSLSDLGLRVGKIFTWDESLVEIIDKRWRDSGLSRVCIRCDEACVGENGDQAAQTLSCIDHLKSLKAEELDISILVKGSNEIRYDLFEDDAHNNVLYSTVY
ncbi:uncharacterized protein EV420DRAFT_1070776 [Desarmillaria tabescens]|uniref:F-box domain-containing protein n=1 Tax=Armillaria tabescens TaxID=1929756 RepID=A0AA39MQD8_ARMTA|nr:uncharacterized protein EV420DRAFT_1070776 [Desarmillaria tabescens]KAK0442772.1 hypothetical protein EV420DRAFT_1070776 [Desarmillaria tabescens]